MKEEVESRELSECIMRNWESKSSGNPPGWSVIPTASALVAQEGNPNRKPQSVYCKAEHYFPSCEGINTVPACIEVLRYCNTLPLSSACRVRQMPSLQDLNLANASFSKQSLDVDANWIRLLFTIGDLKCSRLQRVSSLDCTSQDQWNLREEKMVTQFQTWYNSRGRLD